MQWLINFITAHQTAVALGAMWIGSNFVSALPSPNTSSGMFYKFFFSLTHGLAGSIPRVFPNLRMPGDPSRTESTFFGAPNSTK